MPLPRGRSQAPKSPKSLLAAGPLAMHDATRNTDVYSLGTILYELLAGRLPFDLSNCTPTEASTIIVEREPEKPSALAKKPDSKKEWADLDVLRLTAMHKEPARRYRSVETLIRDIDHYLAGEPLEARPDKLGYRLGKFAGRHRRSLAAAAVVLTLVAGLVVFFAFRLAAARRRVLDESARTQRIQGFMLNLFGDTAAGPADSLRLLRFWTMVSPKPEISIANRRCRRPCTTRWAVFTGSSANWTNPTNC